MLRIIGRLILVPLGVLLAAVAGVVFIGLSAFFSPAAGVLLWGAAKAAIALFFRVFTDPAWVAETGMDRMAQFARALFAALTVPAVLVGVTAEMFAIRSGLAQIAAAALLAALIPFLMLGGALAATGVQTAILGLFALTGAVAGAVYWLVAGHRAGRIAEQSSLPPAG